MARSQHLVEVPLVEDDEAVTFTVLKEKLLSWVVPGNYENSIFYQVIKDGSKPKKASPLDSRYLDLVIRYMESIKEKN